MAGDLAIGVIGPALRGRVGIGNAGFLVARRVRVGDDVRVTVRGRGEQPLLPGRIERVCERVPVRLRGDQRTAVVVNDLARLS